MKIFEDYSLLPFMNEAHKETFLEVTREIDSTAPEIVLTTYLLTAAPETRREIWSILDPDGLVKDDCWDAWLDEDSRRVLALLLNLVYHEGSGPLYPVYLFDTALCPVLLAAVDFWHRAGQAA